MWLDTRSLPVYFRLIPCPRCALFVLVYQASKTLEQAGVGSDVKKEHKWAAAAEKDYHTAEADEDLYNKAWHKGGQGFKAWAKELKGQKMEAALQSAIKKDMKTQQVWAAQEEGKAAPKKPYLLYAGCAAAVVFSVVIITKLFGTRAPAGYQDISSEVA